MLTAHLGVSEVRQDEVHSITTTSTWGQPQRNVTLYMLYPLTVSINTASVRELLSQEKAFDLLRHVLLLRFKICTG
jgi:hypothetical protein